MPPYYDSLVAKLIVHGASREEATVRLAGALDRCDIRGVATNLPLHRRLVRDPEWRAGGVDTAFLGRWLRDGHRHG